MPTSVDIKNLKINKLTEAQYDAAVQGGVIGENELSVLTDAELEQIQVSALPTASADELGNIYQYVGATDANYTNGYFYKCEGAGDPVVYSWTQVNVQPGNSLPSQSGNDGKFLTTNGTNASWGNRTHELIISGRDDVSEGGVLSIKFNNRNYTSGIRFYGTDNTIKSYMRYDASAGSSAYHGVAINANDYQVYRFCPTHFGTNSDNYFSLGAATLRWANVYTYKLNNGANISVPTVGGKLALQIDTMPTAASSYEGVIYQFTGRTDSTYTNGYFYKCTTDGTTYAWEQVNVQPAGSASSWGSITGTLSNQTDLANALNAKADSSALADKLDKTTAASKLYGTNASGEQVRYNLSQFAAAADLDPLVIQWPVLPEPTASLEGVIYEYVGETNSRYTNGHFYKCTASGSTYVWEPISIQSEIDDSTTSTTATWSSSKINSMIGDVESLLAAI